jgi:hypothetical protein
LTVDYREVARADYAAKLAAGYTEAEAIVAVAALFWVKPSTLKSWLDA